MLENNAIYSTVRSCADFMRLGSHVKAEINVLLISAVKANMSIAGKH